MKRFYLAVLLSAVALIWAGCSGNAEENLPDGSIRVKIAEVVEKACLLGANGDDLLFRISGRRRAG